MRGLVLVLLLGVLGGLAVAAPARAAGEVCNETSYVLDVAKAWRTSTGVAAEGWARIAPGGCAQLGPGPEIDQYLYARSTPAYLGGVREWRGALEVCVDEQDFAIEGVADCDSLGLESRQFRRLTDAERSRAVLAELEDFRDRAQEAGLQRLLMSAGYDIRVVDGFAGRRTRRQVEQFERDAGRSFGADRVSLLAALHEAALERNQKAGLRICNEASDPIAAAIAFGPATSRQSRGWWRIEPGACARPLAERLEPGMLFVHARLMTESGMRPLSGATETWCVSPSLFETAQRTDCEQTGLEPARFRTAPDPVNGGAELRLGDRDFEEAAP